jgi:hypothetical protein
MRGLAAGASVGTTLSLHINTAEKQEITPVFKKVALLSQKFTVQ